MKNYILVFLFSAFALQAQNYRYIYNVKYKRDSTRENSYNTKLALDITKDETKFYPYHFIGIDSANAVSLGGTSSIGTAFDIILVKNRETNVNKNYVIIDSGYFMYESADLLEWKIDSEIKYQDQFKLQKAVTHFKGRTWIAWFCADIPLSVGPYKFYGLPGLIFEIYDTGENYHFKITKSFQLASPYDTARIVEANFGQKAVPISFSQYIELKKNNYYNPYASFKQMTGDWTLAAFGKTIKTAKGLDEIIRFYQEDARRYNNPIEISNAIKY